MVIPVKLNNNLPTDCNKENVRVIEKEISMEKCVGRQSKYRIKRIREQRQSIQGLSMYTE